MNVFLIAGAAVGVLLLGAGAFAFWLNRKLNKKARMLEEAGYTLPASGSYLTSQAHLGVVFNELSKPDYMAADLGYGGTMPHLSMHNPGHSSQD